VPDLQQRIRAQHRQHVRAKRAIERRVAKQLADPHRDVVDDQRQHLGLTQRAVLQVADLGQPEPREHGVDAAAERAIGIAAQVVAVLGV
jgi:hypothetical protein